MASHRLQTPSFVTGVFVAVAFVAEGTCRSSHATRHQRRFVR